MKVLLVTFGDINNPTNGYLIRVSTIYKCLSKEHEVTVIQFVNSKVDNSKNFINVEIGKNHFSYAIKIVFKSLSSIKLIKSNDKIIVEGSIFLPFIIMAKLLRKRVIYDTHGSIVEVSKGLKGVKNFIFRRMIGGFLDSISTKLSDVVITVSEDDAQIFRRYTRNKGKVVVVRHAIDVENIPFYEVPNERVKRAIFVGNLYSVQNYEAVKIILKVAERVKDVEFVIVGDGKELFKDYPPNVRFVGKVPSLREYYKEADVCFIPLTTGTGVKTKVLECMAYGRPVITTKKGIEGLHDVEKLDGIYLIGPAEDISEYAYLMGKLVLNKQYHNLREYVMEKYSVNSICRSLLLLVKN
ncbi:glycosyltransferase family 4 protein [Acidianus ambivalens]|uniref:Glycosyltransferase n=1 Tax=Acidianus ambivalens TaxID=2283 RepID=A0A650CTH7_ACIAM|nr:glycosyltransferase family 4 protein [Acidianus ambivalens]MQL56475.1 glycosyltransferase [Acidianus ambivalens]QGR21108.1 glycosyltransferase [Acidianus ambivalens]